MAKGKIFIGEIMADQVSALHSLESAMAGQISKMDSQIAVLESLNDSVAGSVDKINIKPGDSYQYSFTHPSLVIMGSSIISAFELKCIADGAFVIGGSINSNVAGKSVSLLYNINGGSFVAVGSSSTVANAVVSKQITVSKGDLIRFQITAPSATVGALVENTLFAKYDIANLIDVGAFVMA